MRVVFKSSRFHPVFTGNIAVFCSDERFAEATLEFLKSIGVENADLLVVPGGPAFIAQGETAIVERLELLIREHRAKRVILIAHDDCGYYKHRYPHLSSDRRREVELGDLRKAVEVVKRYGVEVKAYFARLEGNTVVFEEVST